MEGKDSASNKASNDAYRILGIQSGASFEEIQKARDDKILEVENDPILKAKVEASFDALLMDSLKLRQLGQVSNDAVKASNRENSKNDLGSSNLLTRIKSFNFQASTSEERGLFPTLAIPQGEKLIIRVAFGLLGLVLLLMLPDESTQLVLSLSTIILFISFAKGGRGIFKSLGWSVVFLSIGLIVGGVLVAGIPKISDEFHIFTPTKIEGIVSIIFLWIGSFF